MKRVFLMVSLMLSVTLLAGCPNWLVPTEPQTKIDIKDSHDIEVYVTDDDVEVGDDNGNISVDTGGDGCGTCEEEIPACWSSFESKNRLPEHECQLCLNGLRSCVFAEDFPNGAPE